MIEEVKIQVETPEIPFQDQHDSKGFRQDEKWTDSHETLLNNWRLSAIKASEGHNKAGKANKKKHAIFGLPTVLIPVVFSPVCIALEGDPSLPYVSMVGFIATGLFSGVSSFFNYSGKHQNHMDFSARYADIVSTIEFELAKGRKYRRDSDEFLMDIQKSMDANGANAPDL